MTQRPDRRIAAVVMLLLAWVAVPAARQDPAPAVRLSLGGRLGGRLEPCGCASGQLGGLARRAHHLHQRREQYELRLEGGDLVDGGTALDLLKLDAALTVLGMAGYEAVALGPRDLQLPLDELAPYLAAFPGRIVASDVSLQPAPADWPVVPFAELRAPRATVRVASLVGELAGPPAKGLTLREPADAWRAAMHGVAGDTLRILFVHGTETRALAATALDPAPDLVVAVTPSISEPPLRPRIERGVPVVVPGIRGRMLLDVELTRRDGNGHVARYEIVKLADSESRPGALDDPSARAVLLAHRELVAEEGLREQLAGQIEPAGGATYVGSTQCKSCHPAEFAVWQDSKHAVAWTTLVRAEAGELKDKAGKPRYGWPVTKYPDCVGCHVVGYRVRSGFVDPKRTPDLAGVGCEQCHGPGSAHVVLPIKTNVRRGAGECSSCHDFEQSPDFDYAARWKAIEHGDGK